MPALHGAAGDGRLEFLSLHMWLSGQAGNGYTGAGDAEKCFWYRSVGFAGTAFGRTRMGSAQLAERLIRKIQLISNPSPRKRCTALRLKNGRKTSRKNSRLLKTGSIWLMFEWSKGTLCLLSASLHGWQISR